MYVMWQEGGGAYLGDVDPVPVPVSTLVETESPVRHHGWKADDVRVLLGDLDGVGAGEEVEVENTTDDIVLETVLLAGVAEFDVHPVGVQEKHAVGARGAVLKVDGVVPVQVRVLGNAIGVPGPEGASGVCGVQTKRLGVLAEAVDVWVLGQVRLEAQELVLEDEGIPGGVEELLAGGAPADGEAEGRLFVVEHDV